MIKVVSKVVQFKDVRCGHIFRLLGEKEVLVKVSDKDEIGYTNAVALCPEEGCTWMYEIGKDHPTEILNGSLILE